uniref:Uncharacterized protein n=1 Tax=Vibrio splendidus TaxID=29497 RepID=A0A0H3ZPX1_VIBSP|nr:hypothetical protein [Vibrio splendidus]
MLFFDQKIDIFWRVIDLFLYLNAKCHALSKLSGASNGKDRLAKTLQSIF